MGASFDIYVFQAMHGLVYGMLLFLAASGFSLVFGMMGVLNIAHVSFYMLGAHFAYSVTLYLGSFWLSLLISPLIDGVSLEVEEREIVALVGRNGVGKSRTLKSIVGTTPPQMGSIRFKGEELVGLRPYKISKMGIGYVPEERRIFGNLAVRQNLLIGIKPTRRLSNPGRSRRSIVIFRSLRREMVKRGGIYQAESSRC